MFVLYVASIVLFGVGVLTQDEARELLAPFPAVGLLLGLVLLLNVSGAAQAVSLLMREQRPMGVDYSKSWLASTGYMRFFGGFMALIGTGMLFAVLTQPVSEL